MKFTKDFFTKANRKVLIAVIGTIGSIILVPIIILLFFTGVTVSFFDIFSMDKMAFTSMVSDPNNTCRNPQGVIMAAEWLYTVGGTQPNGSRPQNHIEYARSFRKTNSRGREIVGYHGKSFVYGWDSRWNQIISPYYNRGEKIWQDQREGLDCSGFVSWAFWNAGFKEVKPATSADGTVTKWGILRDPVTSVEPGDYAHRSGHIGIVVEVNEEGVYVIESQGHRQDLRKNFYSFEKIKNRKSGFTDFYYSNLYDTGDSSCNWNIPSIYVNSSNIFVDVKNTRITLEEYIMGTLKNELNWGENINAEALKAQAVAARTYVLYHAIKNDFPRKVTLKMEKNNNSKADDPNDDYNLILNVLNTTTTFQSYSSPNSFSDKEKTRLLNEVIGPTAGMVMIYNNKLIDSEYSACDKDTDYRVTPSTKEHVPTVLTRENLATGKQMKEDGELPGPYNRIWIGECGGKANAHNRGMEQRGAVLMSLIAGWTYTDILNYYYDYDNDVLININDWLKAEMPNLIQKYGE